MPENHQQDSERTTNNSDSEKVNSERFFVVGIGASAGGLRALEELFANLPIDSGAAFVVIPHLSPVRESLMKELLQRHTEMMVYRIIDRMKLRPNSVYLIPPGKNLQVEGSWLRLKRRQKKHHRKYEVNFSVDIFLKSLAKNFGRQAIAVILSGSGSDGTQGIKAIKEAEGIVLVQEPSTAEFNGMLLNAIDTGVVDRILPPYKLAQLIYQCVISPHDLAKAHLGKNTWLDSSRLKEIVNLLIEEEHLDFSHYKATTISRRIDRRRLINNLEDIDDYPRFAYFPYMVF